MVEGSLKSQMEITRELAFSSGVYFVLFLANPVIGPDVYYIYIYIDTRVSNATNRDGTITDEHFQS